MRSRLLALLMMVLPAPAIAETADERALATARAAIKGLGESLREQLMAAIKDGGPKAAIAQCRAIAPAAAAASSKEHGVEIRRTALRVRNPANAPDAWERTALEEFVARMAAGEEAAKLEKAETVSEGGVATLRYAKAIPMAAEPCVLCHGPSIDPALAAEIVRLYPEDQATGFKAGDLRGAFSVRVPVRR